MSSVLLAGCAIMKDGKILLIRKTDRDFWELPGGVVNDRNEEEQKAAEKTAMQIGVTPKIIQHFTILEYQKDGKNIEATIFECDVDPESEFAPGDNVKEVRWFEIGDIPENDVGNDVKAILEELR